MRDACPYRAAGHHVSMTSLAKAAQHLIGRPILRAEPLHGGDLSEVIRLGLQGGEQVIAKSGPSPMTEAAMLNAIRATGAPAPRVIAVDDNALVLEALPERGGLSGEAWANLGRLVRTLHDATGDRFGWAEDYAFGSVAILNAPAEDWPIFWGERRMLAEVERLPADIGARLERLCSRLPDLLPPRPRACLLHGDLWTGNVLVGESGVWLIDPACYYGHGEVDLAMLNLFGSPTEAFWAEYGAPEPGWPERCAIYQLWPAIVHLRLFSAGYRGMVESRLGAVGA